MFFWAFVQIKKAHLGDRAIPSFGFVLSPLLVRVCSVRVDWGGVSNIHEAELLWDSVH